MICSINATPLERTMRRLYAKGLVGAYMFFSVAATAGTTQERDVPESWAQGAEGYGHRFGKYAAKQAVQRGLRLAGVEMHEATAISDQASREWVAAERKARHAE